MAAATLNIFKVGHNDMEKLFALPATAASSTDQPQNQLNVVVTSMAVAMSRDRMYRANDMQQGLLSALDDGSRTDESKITILNNIKRWALEGLENNNNLRFALSHLSVNHDARLFSNSGVIGTGRYAVANNSSSQSITAKQARLILANAFLGNCHDPMAPYKNFMGGLDFRPMLKNSDIIGQQKIKCLLLYFEACGSTLEGSSDDARQIVFNRIRFLPLQLSQQQQQQNNGSGDNFLAEQAASLQSKQKERYVGEGVVIHNNPMESPTRQSSAFINFANSNFGYGEFISSCTQEEILQMCCPEFNVGMLFIDEMHNNEVVNVSGIKRFCTYSGYLRTFRCEGPCDDDYSIQSILTLDATYKNHFSNDMLDRDVSKAFYSFREHCHDNNNNNNSRGGGMPPVISTGKWGCGAFGGMPAHKFLQQCLAANLAGVDLEFSAFGSDDRCSELLAALNGNKPRAETVVKMLLHCKNKNAFVDDAISFLSSSGPGSKSGGKGAHKKMKGGKQQKSGNQMKSKRK